MKDLSVEEKNLLLQDLCVRLRYGVFLKIGEYSDYILQGIILSNANKPLIVRCNGSNFDCSIKIVRPYLRPMSSMTEEERIEFTELFYKWHDDELFDYIEEGTEFSIWKHKGISPVVFDWLNQKMFDYHGLIPMGLAVEAPKDMYNINNK